MTALFRRGAWFILHCLLLTACIEPKLHLPAENVLIEMPVVVMDMEVVWNVDIDWETQWHYGWDVIDEETKSDPSYQEGEEWGRQWGQRMKDYAEDELVPAAKVIAAEAAEAASAAGKGMAAVASNSAEVAGKGFRAVVGDEAADKTEDFIDEKLAPIGRSAAELGRGVFDAVKPFASKAAKKGSELAATAGEKLAESAKDMLK